MDPSNDDMIMLIVSSCAFILEWISNRQDIEDRVPRPLRADARREAFIRLYEESDTQYRNHLRMNRAHFFNLCAILRGRCLLHDTIHVTVEEQLAMFLHTVGHGQTNMNIGGRCYRSGETISCYFHGVLQAIGSLKNEYIQGPSVETHHKIMHSAAFWPYFKDCVGAIDGTHIQARLPSNMVGRFRGRKGIPTQNVLAAVNFDTKFTFVLTSWEGSAHDETVLRDAIQRENGLRAPEGKYYLCDAGYSTRDGFIAPYRTTRYHLKEFRGRGPQDYKELFNYRHSSLRTTVEWAFGILKKRFAILADRPFFPFRTQVNFVIVCCILHNYIISNGGDCMVTTEDEWMAQNLRHDGMTQDEIRESQDNWVQRREEMAMAMWDDYNDN